MLRQNVTYRSKVTPLTLTSTIYWYIHPLYGIYFHILEFPCRMILFIDYIFFGLVACLTYSSKNSVFTPMYLHISSTIKREVITIGVSSPP